MYANVLYKNLTLVRIIAVSDFLESEGISVVGQPILVTGKTPLYIC